MKERPGIKRKRPAPKQPGTERIESLDEQGRLLAARISQMEVQLRELEQGLSEGRLERYRERLLERVQAEYVETFRTRSALIEARYGNMDAWGALRGRLRACLIISRAVEEARVRGVEGADELVRVVQEGLAEQRARFEMFEQPEGSIREAYGWLEDARQ